MKLQEFRLLRYADKYKVLALASHHGVPIAQIEFNGNYLTRCDGTKLYTLSITEKGIHDDVICNGDVYSFYIDLIDKLEDDEMMSKSWMQTAVAYLNHYNHHNCPPQLFVYEQNKGIIKETKNGK